VSAPRSTVKRKASTDTVAPYGSHSSQHATVLARFWPIGTRLAALAILATAIAAVYCRTLTAPFIFDDAISIESNPSITHLWPLVGDSVTPGPLAPPRDLPTAGRPLVNYSFALNYHFGRLDPIGYRLVNLALHLLCAALLAGIVRRTLTLDCFGGRFIEVSGALGWIVATVWAVHPLLTEAVAYVTQRTELMVSFFYLGTIYASLRYWTASTRIPTYLWLVVATIACFCGMASKEIMVTAPIAIVMFDWIFISRGVRQMKRSWPLFVFLASGWMLLFYLHHNAPRSHSAGFHLGVPAYVWWFTQAKVLWNYFQMAVWPWPLAIHYDLPYLDSIAKAWPWLLATTALLALTLMLLWKRSAAAFPLSVALLVLLPTLVVPIRTEVAADRRMYLPLAALIALLCIAAFLLAERLATSAIWSASATQKKMKPTPGLRPLGAARNALVCTFALAGILTLVLASLSTHHLEKYRDEISLWRSNLALYPDDYISHGGLGSALLKAARQQSSQGNPERAHALNMEAAREFEWSLRFKEDYPDAHNELGSALFNMGRLFEAIAHYQRAVELSPGHAQAHSNLGAALAATNHSDEAIGHFRIAIHLAPYLAEAHYDLGKALFMNGDLSGALAEFERSIELEPDYFEARTNRAVVLAKWGRIGEAIAEYQQVLRDHSTYVEAWANLAQAHAEVNAPAEAIAEAERALDLARSQQQLELAAQIDAWLREYRSPQPSALPTP
jgi:protein O-mannosyl-transferase